MTDEELKQFGELAKKFEAKDKEAVLKVVRADIHPVFQEINDGGRTAANTDHKTKLDALTAERDGLKTRAEKAEQDLKELDGKAPDATKLREKYETDLKAERDKHAVELTKRDQDIVGVRLEVAKQRLVEKLASEGREIDPEYASTVVVNRQDIVDRIQVTKDSPDIKVLKAGSRDLHIVPADGKDALDHLADEVAAGVADKWKGSKVRKGSGSNTGAGGSGGSKDRFENIRERAKTRSEEKAKSKEQGSGLDRLSGGRRA